MNDDATRSNIVLRLQGKCEFIAYNKIKIQYIDDATKVKLCNISKGESYSASSPLCKNGFYMIINDNTRLFAPNLTTDKKRILGHNVDIVATYQQYNIPDNSIFGWNIIAVSIAVNECSAEYEQKNNDINNSLNCFKSITNENKLAIRELAEKLNLSAIKQSTASNISE